MERGRVLRAARLTNYALASPEQLQREEEQFVATMRGDLPDVTPETDTYERFAARATSLRVAANELFGDPTAKSQPS